jgi:hypothetical protein
MPQLPPQGVHGRRGAHEAVGGMGR